MKGKLMSVAEALNRDDLRCLAFELRMSVEAVKKIQLTSTPLSFRGTEVWLDEKDVLVPYVRVRGKKVEGAKINGKATRSFRVGEFPISFSTFGNYATFTR